MSIRWNAEELTDQDSAGVADDSRDDFSGGLKQRYELGSLTDGLVAYFPFDGDVKDSVLSHSVTDNTSAGFVSGKVGSEAKDFDGEDDDVDVSGPVVSSPDEGVTVSAWVRFSSASSQATIVAGYSSEDSTITSIIYNNDGNDLAYYLKDETGTNANWGYSRS